MSSAPRLLTDLRGQRYGEVILAYLDDVPRIDVYNSFTLNDCPDELWGRLDAVAIAREFGATLALFNGPRFWMMDGIAKVVPVEPLLGDFGGISMRRVATIEIDGPLGPSYYVERHVNRGAAWHYDAGKPVYELISPTGSIYVLQAYCVGVDASLNESALEGLGERLDLPAGWSFRTRVLLEELVIDTTRGLATVVQDELQNTYSMTT